jgi:voltage-gated potassium channel
MRGASRPGSVRALRRRDHDEGEFEQHLRALDERLDPFMAWLGVLFALLVGFEIAVPLAPGTAEALTWAGWALWAVFALEYAVKLWLAPRRLRFARRHWLQALFLVLPTLRFLSFVRLLRLGRALPGARVVSSSYRVAGTARRLFASRLQYLGAISAVAVIAVAEAAYLFERDRQTFESFVDALLWSLAVVIGMQGDPTPTSVPGRLVMTFGFAVGLVVVATVAGTIGAFLVEDHRERAARFE